jgi:hypothetical protein
MNLQSNQKELLEISKKRQEEIKAIQKQIIMTKQEEAKERKKEREMNDKRKKEIELESIKLNQEKKVMVKQVELNGQEKLINFKKQKITNSKAHYQERVKQEHDDISKRQEELARLESMESELIKKLQHTQTVQKQAFDELESALKYSPGKE